MRKYLLPLALGALTLAAAPHVAHAQAAPQPYIQDGVDIGPALAQHECLNRLQAPLKTYGHVMVNWFSGAASDGFDVRARFAALDEGHVRQLARIDALASFAPGELARIDDVARGVSKLRVAYLELVAALQEDGKADESFLQSLILIEGALAGVQEAFKEPTTGCDPAVARVVTDGRPRLAALQKNLAQMRLHVATAQSKRLVLARMAYLARRDSIAAEFARATQRELAEVTASIQRIWLAASLQDEIAELQVSASRGGKARGLMSRYLQYLPALNALRVDRAHAEQLQANLAASGLEPDLRRPLETTLSAFVEGSKIDERDLLARGWAGQLATQNAVAARYARNPSASASCTAAVAEHGVAAAAARELTTYAAVEAAFRHVADACP